MAVEDRRCTTRQHLARITLRAHQPRVFEVQVARALGQSVEIEGSVGLGVGGNIHVGPARGALQAVPLQYTVSWDTRNAPTRTERSSLEIRGDVLQNIGAGISGELNYVQNFRFAPEFDGFAIIYAGPTTLGPRISERNTDWVFSFGGGLYAVVGGEFNISFNLNQFIRAMRE